MITTENRLMTGQPISLHETSTYSVGFGEIHLYLAVLATTPATSVMPDCDERKRQRHDAAESLIRIDSRKDSHTAVIRDHEPHFVKNLPNTDQRHPLGIVRDTSRC